MGKRMHGGEDHPNKKQGQCEKKKNARGSYNKLRVFRPIPEYFILL